MRQRREKARASASAVMVLLVLLTLSRDTAPQAPTASPPGMQPAPGVPHREEPFGDIHWYVSASTKAVDGCFNTLLPPLKGEAETEKIKKTVGGVSMRSAHRAILSVFDIITGTERLDDLRQAQSISTPPEVGTTFLPTSSPFRGGRKASIRGSRG